MLREVSLAELIPRVRKAADIEEEDRFGDSEITSYLNAMRGELHEHLVLTGEDYATSPTPAQITTAPGVPSYALPEDFFKIRAVFVSIGGVLKPLRPWRLEELDQYQYQTGWNVGSPIAYHRMETFLVLQPTPTAVYPVALFYAKAPPRFTSLASKMNCEAGWEEFMIFGAAAMALEKDELDSGTQRAQQEHHRMRIVRMAANTDYGEPQRITRRRQSLRALRWRS